MPVGRLVVKYFRNEEEGTTKGTKYTKEETDR